MGTATKRILIDQAIPTDKTLEHRRPDLTVRLAGERRVVIFEVACAWDPLVGTREKEKRAKYQELAADLVNQWPGFRAVVIPVVIGDLGVIESLRKHLKRSRLLSDVAIQRFMAEAQRETLCSAVRLIKRHLALE